MVRRCLVIFAAILLACVTSTYAESADTLLWKKVDGWEIRVDKSVGFGCFMFAAYNGGTVLRVGIDKQAANGYVVIADQAWRSLEVGRKYELVFRFDDDPSWRGIANAIQMGNGNSVALRVDFRNSSFLVELAKKNTLVVRYHGRLMARLHLTGTYDAVNELARCQAAVDKVLHNSQQNSSSEKRGSNDPFAPVNRATKSDPFRQ